ncbi:tetratricopeptide repeat protein [Zavarzinia compransoris]|uniref:Uncharacterized protein n=1 Tax=Zavarzinia compransoris TaxID=1264899 RepID=A0A317E7B4_9PROT|nr:tetratricopeptide repeat protein [Zavarzinia compransoris]PWR22126.1 hypothetical protein DKG75_09140 [Zavarzinia compransoris]TDP47125.1 tetratricopeptide repeat protein [Zavarzinia compransoris]
MPPLKQATAALALGLAVGFAALPARALTYGECVDLVSRAPADGFNAALAWTKRSDDPAAQHCAVLAEVALKRYGAAGERLSRLIDQMTDPREAAALLGQLGNIRLLDNKPDLALKAFDRALRNTPNDADLLADRARARAALNDWPRAAADLDAAVQLRGDDRELQLLFATALREAGKLAEAKGAIAKALQLAPGDPAALLERGRIRLLDGDRKGAAADWKEAAAKAPAGPIRDAAAASLKALDKAK